MAGKDVWKRHAAQWGLIEAPLRPSSEVVRDMRALLPAHTGHGLLLGVTPELLAVSDKLTAVDCNPDMVAQLWRPQHSGHRLHIADWRCMAPELLGGNFAFTVGDGCLTVLPVADYARVFTQLEQLLPAGALCILRVFATPPPEAQETVEAVFASAYARQISGFSAFKWRLAMALVAERQEDDIAVQHIWEIFTHHVPQRAEFATATGWPLAAINTIDAYYASATIYSFPTLAALEQYLPPRWRIEKSLYGTYELAERCPVLAIRYA